MRVRDDETACMSSRAQRESRVMACDACITSASRPREARIARRRRAAPPPPPRARDARRIAPDAARAGLSHRARRRALCDVRVVQRGGAARARRSRTRAAPPPAHGRGRACDRRRRKGGAHARTSCPPDEPVADAAADRPIRATTCELGHTHRACTRLYGKSTVSSERGRVSGQDAAEIVVEEPHLHRTAASVKKGDGIALRYNGTVRSLLRRPSGGPSGPPHRP